MPELVKLLTSYSIILSLAVGSHQWRKVESLWVLWVFEVGEISHRELVTKVMEGLRSLWRPGGQLGNEQCSVSSPSLGAPRRQAGKMYYPTFSPQPLAKCNFFNLVNNHEMLTEWISHSNNLRSFDLEVSRKFSLLQAQHFNISYHGNNFNYLHFWLFRF